jgi:hypothetical protein
MPSNASAVYSLQFTAYSLTGAYSTGAREENAKEMNGLTVTVTHCHCKSTVDVVLEQHSHLLGVVYRHVRKNGWSLVVEERA